MTTKHDHPSFPIIESDNGLEHTASFEGLTKREWFAGMALCGLMGDSSLRSKPETFAKDAVTVADALIEALNND